MLPKRSGNLSVELVGIGQNLSDEPQYYFCQMPTIYL